MSRAAPPQKKPRVAAKQTQGQKSIKLSRRYRPDRFPASYYWRLLAHRCARGLLVAFKCAACGVMALDPIGRIGKREFLWGSCADSTEREAKCAE
jgi:hypothetical protein